MSYNLFEKMKELIAQAQKETAGTDRPLFTSYQNDFHEHDHDEINFDAQHGDNYIWIIKENGCGTRLLMAGSEYAQNSLKTFDDLSRIFHIKVDGPNSGEIKQIDKKRATDLINNCVIPESRVPRRVSFVEQLNRLVYPGADHSSTSVTNTWLMSDLSPKKGDKSVLRIKLDAPTRTLSVEVVRTKIAPAGKYEVRSSKDHETYRFNATIGALQEYKDKPKCVLLDSKFQSYAEVTEITDKAFQKAVKNLEAKKQKEKELGL
ncbi:hypothetical protein [Aeromonas sp. MrichA-1]|uniref:hypothetical protein n=1 Tax=Aeromonas sp. MrichA-1 TaxID=2823362 RepID=UPI001B33FBB2|nr:hypothetical protein [Aeromonas sp. MrichA-1]MBP4081749.1 hypothetical protein [Aeromonas sp. MrichA-1]